MNIYSANLNLLQVFDAIFVERSVSRAAVWLGVVSRRLVTASRGCACEAYVSKPAGAAVSS
ncbi:hypothetical protein [Paraburkholderia sp. D1E]|uniref:hypothetical protein n=1 Tax=Paraburkholderia sp. D1E TaxID=3461398 RepID=UPI0040459BB2